MRGKAALIASIITICILTAGCILEDEEAEYPIVDREDKIPLDSVKVTPATDAHPPVLHSEEFEEPVPVGYPINTAGGEDSPYILEDGNTMYFFFTPDVGVPVEKQVIDDVTGIYVSRRTGGSWSRPERVWLQDPGKLALDGAQTIVGKKMYFASAREGYTGLHIFTADLVDGNWTNWKYGGNRLKELEVGELHVVGDDMYFHSPRAGGKGAYDLWKITWDGSDWSEPVNLEELNSEGNEGWPYVTPDGKEIWFTRQHSGAPSIWMSRSVNGTWEEPVLVLEMFAGEPTLDSEGNLYFVHHYFKDDVMIEADIYVCYRK
jgi:Tol biopolymer transport system component